MDYSLTPVQLSNILKASLAIEDGPIILIEGPPGIGKSEVVGQVAKELNRELIDSLRASQVDAPDLRGAPDIMHSNGKLKWFAPEFFPLDPASTAIIFCDEVGQGLPTTQAGMMQLILEGAIGPHKLGKKVGIVAATNRVQDRAGVHKLLAPLSRRFSHVTLKVDVPQWCKWAVGPYGQSQRMDYRIVALIRFKADLLHDFDPQRDVDPNPRAWQKVSVIVQMGLPAFEQHALIAGTVGEGAATVTTAFLKICDRLPNIDAILLAPKTVDVPRALDVKCAVATGVGMAATPANMQAVIHYAERLGEELEQFCVTTAATHNPSVCSTHAFTKWAAEH